MSELAEERIGISASKGIVSYISNSSWLTGRSHPMMRQSIVRNFREIWIDNLNGDKFKTGKIIPKGIPGAGTRDDSAFTTPLDPRGIMPGTAIATMLKRTGETGSSSGAPTKVHYRDLWGVAAGKRRHLLESLPSGAPKVGSGAPPYVEFIPEIGMRWRLAPVDSEGGYEAWPALDELFPERPQGVNPNRGLDGSLVDTSKAALQQRMKAYLEAPTFAAAEALAPVLATKRARYDPEAVRDKLVAGGGYTASKVVPYLAFPFDQRWIYYDPRFKLLNEARSELGDIIAENEFLITVPEPRKLSEALPAYSRALVRAQPHGRAHQVRHRGDARPCAQRDGVRQRALQLARTVKATIRPVDRDNDKAPDTRVFAGAVEIGAGWTKAARETGTEYLSLTPKLGRSRGKDGKKVIKYGGRILVAARLAGTKIGVRSRRFDGSRIGRGASMGRLLSSRDRLAGFRSRRAVVKASLVRLAGKAGQIARAHIPAACSPRSWVR